MSKKYADFVRNLPEYREVKKRLGALASNKEQFGCYLVGLFESDGHSRLTLKLDQDRPEIRISQKDSAFLVALLDVLETQYGIKSRITFEKKNRRADYLTIDSWTGAGKLIKLMKESFSPILGLCCAGPKSKELLAIEILLDRPKYTKTEANKAIVVDLKTRWHELAERDQAKDSRSREQNEERKGLKQGTSKNAAELMQKQMNQQYAEHATLLDAYKNGTLSIFDKAKLPNLASYYLTGLLEGDGCFVLDIYPRKNKKDGPITSIDVTLSITLTGTNVDLPSHEAFKTALGIQGTITSTADKLVTKIQTIDDVQKVLGFVKQNPVCRTKNLVRFETLLAVAEIKAQRKSQKSRLTPEELVTIVDKAYAMPTSHGKVRRNYEETINAIRTIFPDFVYDENKDN